METQVCDLNIFASMNINFFLNSGIKLIHKAADYWVHASEALLQTLCYVTAQSRPAVINQNMKDRCVGIRQIDKMMNNNGCAVKVKEWNEMCKWQVQNDNLILAPNTVYTIICETAWLCKIFI